MRILSLVAGSCLLFASVAFACPLCRDSVATTSGDAATASIGYNGNIEWMLGGLLLVGIMLARAMWKTVRSER